MIGVWGPARNAADGYYPFARGAVRWDRPGGGDLRFLVFGNPGWDEEPYRRRERRRLRRGLRALGLAVCASEEYPNLGGPASWALVVRPREQPRDEEAAGRLEARLNALVWRAVCRAQGIAPRRRPPGRRPRPPPDARRAGPTTVRRPDPLPPSAPGGLLVA